MQKAIEKRKSGVDPEVYKAKTIPELFLDRVERLGDRVALRQKRYGIWNEISWTAYGEAVKDVAAGLISFDIQPGDKVAVLAVNRVEWLYAELGIQSARATTVGIYPTDTVQQCAFIVGHSEARVWIVEDQEQFDKAMEAKDQLPHLQIIVVIDEKGLHDVDSPNIISYAELMRRGRESRQLNPELLENRINAVDEDDIAIFAYTSGTTGNPKGAMLSHKSLIGIIEPTMRGMGFEEGEEHLCYLPLCHIAERAWSILGGLHLGFTVNCIEEPDTLLQNLKEVSPTVFFGFPRLWERLMAQVEIEIDDSSWLHRKIFSNALEIGYRYSCTQLNGESPSVGLKLMRKLVDWLVFWKLRERLGLRRARFSFCGGAPIAPRVLEFFHAIGVPIHEGFGMTEVSCACSFMPRDRIKFGTVGIALPGIEVKISDNGEILVKSPGNFQGYFKEPEKTAETLRDGWVHTGDVGQIDEEGYLIITGRIKDLIILSTGHNIAPQNIENDLKSSSYIMDSVIIGDNRPYPVALIIIDEDPVAHFCRMKGITFSTYADLTRQPEVIELIESEVKKVNKQFADRDQIVRYKILEWELDDEEGELTPTGKVKRSHLCEQFSEVIEKLYTGQP